MIGYNLVIDLDGTVENGRPLSMAGAHCADRGLFGESPIIFIPSVSCYVGGLDKNGNPKDTRTEAQKKALIELVKK